MGRPTKGTWGQQMRLGQGRMMEKVLSRGVMTRGAQGVQQESGGYTADWTGDWGMRGEPKGLESLLN